MLSTGPLEVLPQRKRPLPHSSPSPRGAQGFQGEGDTGSIRVVFAPLAAVPGKESLGQLASKVPAPGPRHESLGPGEMAPADGLWAQAWLLRRLPALRMEAPAALGARESLMVGPPGGQGRRAGRWSLPHTSRAADTHRVSPRRRSWLAPDGLSF